jgi:hypothetical protein
MSKLTTPNPKPGQKYDCPKITDPLYKFYKSTLKQTKGKSQMALKWCLEHGVLSRDKALQIDTMNKLAQLKIKKNVSKQ